jgi:hypothetical protein
MTGLWSAGFLIALCCTSAPPALAQESTVPPVLSICEALRNLNVYRGKDVVIVGYYGETFEGPFMDEKCEPDGNILIQGHRWLSMIALWPTEKATATHEPFPVDETILREKLGQVNGYHATVQGSEPPEMVLVGGRVLILRSGGWGAVYGRLDSPVRLKPYVTRGASNRRNIPGNGYGANGTVPVRIFVIIQEPLD